MSRRSNPTSSLNVGYGNYDYSTQNGNSNYPPKNVDSMARPVSNPYMRETKTLKKKNIKNSSMSFPMKILPWILSVALVIICFLTRHQLKNVRVKLSQSHSDIRGEVQSCSRRIQDLNTNNSDLKEKLSAQSSNNSKMQSEWTREKKSLEAAVGSQKSLSQTTSVLQKEVSNSKMRESAWKSRINRLTRKIERESYRDALETFGEGPHQVKFYVDLPRDSEKDAALPDGEHHSFIIELYPLMAMPHAVHLFLQQVYHGLWDGCSFVVNAPHILQAGTFPGGNTVVTYAEKIKAFEDVGLDVVSYQEYSEEHPHKQWTVGFAGRPGGPDFYINKLDNTNNHGPGGQIQHRLGEEADPCFGHIVEGKDILERMYEMKTDAKHDWVMDNPVHIVKARILIDAEDEDKVKDIRSAKSIPHLEEMHGSFIDETEESIDVAGRNTPAP